MAARPATNSWGLTEFMRPERPSLGDTVVTALVERIVGARLEAGTALPSELEIGEQLGVSRTVVRESLKRLQSKGLILSRQGVGAVVLPMASWDLIDDVVLDALVRHDDSLAILDDLVRVRAALEMMMAEEAARRPLPPSLAPAPSSRPRPPDADTAEGLERIRAALVQMEEVRSSTVDFAKADVEFHAAIMELSGNLLGQAIVTSIHDKARTTDRYHGATSDERFRVTLEEHRVILAAIAEGRPVDAGRFMRAHIVDSWARRRLDTA